MAYIVGENCINCKHSDCVTVCPVDCFVEGPNFLALNPYIRGETTMVSCIGFVY